MFLLFTLLVLHDPQLRRDVELLQVAQLEGLSVLHPHVWALLNAREVVNQVHEFFVVLFVVVERDYRNPVVQLVPERIHCVVHDQQVVQTLVLYYPQVFYVNAFGGFDAVLAVEPEVYQLLRLLPNF